MEGKKGRRRGHDTLDHTADMGIVGWGAGQGEAFEEIAAAMFELIAGKAWGETITSEVPIRCEGRRRVDLLVEFLNELLTMADIEDVVFTSVSVVRLEHENDLWKLEALAAGVRREAAGWRLQREVKAATYCGARVGEAGAGIWEARCVVDL